MVYKTILTDTGIAKLTNAQITGTAISLSHIALGDGNGADVTLNQATTALTHEVYRGQINHLYRPEDDTAQIVAELVVLPEIGGWTVREVGIFDSDGDLIVYGSHPALYKPVLAEGTGMDYTVAIRALVGNDANITLKIDPGVVIATRKWTNEQMAAHNANAAAHANMVAAHNADANAHNLTELPWINCGTAGLARTGNTTVTIAGDVRSTYPRGKRLRFNGDDQYLCRVFGAPTYANSVTAITLWFDDRTKIIPATVTKFERSRLTPQDTANGAHMSGTDSAETISTLLASYCCGGYWTN